MKRVPVVGLLVGSLVGWLVGGLAGDAQAREKSSSKKSKSQGRSESRSPPSLSLQSVDLVGARVYARVGGATKTPDARLFSFHDDRNRHFIAVWVQCAPAPPLPRPVPVAETDVDDGGGAGAVAARVNAAPPKDPPRASDELLCEIQLPAPYLRANVRGMTVHLHGKEVAADESAVRGLWASAEKPPARPSVPPFTQRVPGDLARAPRPSPPVDDPGFLDPKAEPMSPAPVPSGAETEDEGGDEDEGAEE